MKMKKHQNNRLRSKGFLQTFIFIFFPFSTCVLCDKIDRIVAKARNKTGKVIRCSPDGKKPGTISLQEALKKVMSGNILEITPGYYRPYKQKEVSPDWYKRCQIYLTQKNNIVIQGDGTGNYSNLRIAFWGKNIVVRNIWMESVEGEHITIIDSKISWITITNGGRKIQPVIYNCSLNGMTVYADKSEVTVKNCSLIRQYAIRDNAQWSYTNYRGVYNGQIYLGAIQQKGTIKFENCVLYTVDYMFRQWGGSFKALTLIFQNSVIYSATAYGWAGKEIRSMDELKQYCKVIMKGDNVLQKPVFQAKLRNGTFQVPKAYLLAPNSPGKQLNAGIIGVQSNGLPSIK